VRNTAAQNLFLILTGLSLLAPRTQSQENTLRVEFDQDPSRATSIGALERQGIQYASVNDLARLFSVSAARYEQTGKLELRQPPFTVTLCPDNPFVVFRDQNRRETVYQLRHGVVYGAGSYYIPLDSFRPLFGTLLNSPVAYLPAERTLKVGSYAAGRGYDIPAVQLEQKINGTMVRIRSSKHLDDYESWVHTDGWLYVTIADALADTLTINATKPVGLVKEIVAIQSPTAVQLTFRLSGKVSTTEVIRDNASHDLLVSIHAPTPDEKQVPERTSKDLQAGLENHRKRWELDVIVLDPGHGGYDPGTIGVTGVKEKDITLGIALKLGRLIKKNMKEVSVVYTRRDDRFVQLDRRGQIANEAGGKLFVSIHCNSMKRKPNPTQGFEVYLLRLGKDDEAIAIAERENAVIKLEEGYQDRYKELTEENFIFVTMAQAAYVKASEVFADLAQQHMRAITGLTNHGVKQAGFYVLVGAAMPNVLVEAAYLSNRKDEKFLKSEAGQTKIAEALLRAITQYKKEYEKLLIEGKDFGQR
jgi:N-acetylmuramoyl-L-alanine amidase